LAVIEAMLACVPVITSRSGGMVDAVRPDETGLLVDENAPDQIASAVARLLRDPAMARRLADQARAMAMNSYSAAATADAFSRLFAEVSANAIGR
jgi:glycosyltransferase involved in cell wall biosynthesis